MDLSIEPNIAKIAINKSTLQISKNAMYPQKYFEETDSEAIFLLVETIAFGQLILSVSRRPFSTHMPFLLSTDKKKLIGHVARQNPQYSDIEGQEVLAIFQGAHDYI